ncbi:hypothetical protein ICN84_01690 [Akkermansia glycaniphila]|uniref:hypothetical protein n=1 Tax=Akkermansia glycaniphila TaxID=1679444 RepID=UPI001C023C39|nr:hypothetical protein [Akkermansia glycaniphila]MBT9448783.1 hypothetical protein [Akkermansia glycaniphila]
MMNVVFNDMTRKDLPNILYQLLQKLGGKASMMTIFREFWKVYGNQLSPTDDMFYTWNYDIRWAATQLRQQKRMRGASTKENTHGVPVSPKGIWEII